MKLFAGADKSATLLTAEIPAGKYRALVVELIATNNAGQTLANTEIGTIRVTRNGEEIISAIDFADILSLNNADGGAADFASAIGAGVTCQARVCFHLPADSVNIAEFRDGEGQVQILMNATGMAKLASGSFSVYAVYGDGVESYLPKLSNFGQTLPASGVINVVTNISNVQRVYFRTASQFGNIFLQKGSDLLYNADSGALKRDTGYNYRLESTPAFILLDLAKVPTFANIASRQIEMQLTSAGAGNAVIVLQHLSFDSARTSATRNTFTAKETAKLDSTPAVKAVVQSLNAAD